MKRLGRSFFARPAEVVAEALLGKIVVRDLGGRRVRARLVETEAYVGTHDLACHASKGRTPRTEPMFGRAGHLYVYLVYGMHHMLNVVTGRVGDGEAVLLRAAEPVDTSLADARGPGKLAKALGIDRSMTALDACAREALHFEDGPPPDRIGRSPRIGVDYAGAWAAAPLRFCDEASRHVSGPRRR